MCITSDTPYCLYPIQFNTFTSIQICFEKHDSRQGINN